MFARRAVCAGFAVIVAIAPIAARAEQRESYVVDGRDVFRIGTGDVRTRTSYHGTQTLVVKGAGDGSKTFSASVDYERNGDDGKRRSHASYVTTVRADGTSSDGPANDPDYLTVLNQPFAVHLDAATLRDLSHVKRPVPFAFPSPMTGAPLRGTLRRLGDGMIGGQRALGIAFEAGGPLHGALPDRPELALAGTISMKGTAYYAYGDATLIALDAALTIDGAVDADGNQKKAPVSILYARSIRPAASAETARVNPSPKRT